MTSPRVRWLQFGGVAMLLVAAFMRFAELEAMPPGFQFDEAYNALDAAQVLDGTRPLFFPANGGREPLAAYAQAATMAVVGRDRPVLALRLGSAAIGLITLAVVMAAFGALTRRRLLGWLTATIMAGTFWHLHFSRYGIRAIWAPLWITLAVWAWWQATSGDRHRAARTPRWGPTVVCGLALAGAFYSHPTGRLLPLVLIGHGLYRWGAQPQGRPRILLGLLAAGLVALVVSAPLLEYFRDHPDQFTSHSEDVSLSAVAARDYDGSLPRALAANGLAVAGMFVFRGDPSRFHNLPGLPVFDGQAGILVILFFFGLAVAVGRWRQGRRDGLVLAGLWLGVMLVPTLLSDRAPNFSRAIGALPIICLLPAMGLELGGNWLLRKRAIRQVPSPAARVQARSSGISPEQHPPFWTVTALGLGLVFLAQANRYFGQFASDPELYHSFDADKVDAYHWLQAQAGTVDAYLSPVWAEHATLDYLNRFGAWSNPSPAMRALVKSMKTDGGAWQGEQGNVDQDSINTGANRADRKRVYLAPGGYRPLDFHETLPFAPGDRDLLLASPYRSGVREGLVDAVSTLTRGAAESTTVSVSEAPEPLLTVWRVPRAALGDLRPPTDAPLEPGRWLSVTFGSAIELVGADLGYPASRSPKIERSPTVPPPFQVRLVWRALRITPQPLTVFVQLVDADGEPAGQLDREPAWASHPTTGWRPDEVVIDTYSVPVTPGARGPLTARVGWYDRLTGSRLRLADGSDTLMLAEN